MKKLLVVLGLAMVVGVATYVVYYKHAMGSAVVPPNGADRELAWLEREFALDSAQYEKVLALHRAYRPICDDHCSRYIAAHRRLTEILKTQASWSPEAAAAIAERARIQSECHASMLKYAYDVAACMSADQGRRYLDMIKLQFIDGDPAGMFAAAR